MYARGRAFAHIRDGGIVIQCQVYENTRIIMKPLPEKDRKNLQLMQSLRDDSRVSCDTEADIMATSIEEYMNFTDAGMREACRLWYLLEAYTADSAGKYFESYDSQAYDMALLGLVDSEIAEVIGVSTGILQTWIAKHQSFRDALSSGRDGANAKVAKSLYRKALGYRHKETKVFCSQGEIITEDVIKQYPPDTQACIYWLKTKCPGRWMDMQSEEPEDEMAGVDDAELHSLMNQAGMQYIKGQLETKEVK